MIIDLAALGVHAIFGGFLAGLIIPKDGGYSIKIVEKLEDLVGICFLPLVSNQALLLISQSTHLPCLSQYFALSGLKTNLGLLDNGITWGYVIIICLVAFFGKFIGCALSARALGFNIRESGAIGVSRFQVLFLCWNTLLTRITPLLGSDELQGSRRTYRPQHRSIGS